MVEYVRMKESIIKKTWEAYLSTLSIIVRFISDELRMMQAFLRAADGARENTGVLKAYLELIRDLAYDIEDSLEEFMVFIKHKSLLQQLLSL
jgi:disease resistance protein RPM1